MKIWRLVGLILLLIITLFYALFQGGFVSWFLFYSFTPFGLYAIFLYFYPLKTWTIKREFNQMSFKAGERLVGTIYLSGKRPFLLPYMIIEEILPSTLQVSPVKIIVFPWFRRKLVCQYHIEEIPRGLHKFSTIRIKIGDFLGLIEKEYYFTNQVEFLVYPKIVPIDYRQFLKFNNQGMITSTVKTHHDTMIASGVRDYYPGDRFTWIDWKSTARKNTMMTKEFEQEQSRNMLIFIDRFRSDEFEKIITFSASLLKMIFKKGIKAGLISIGTDRVVFPIANGDGHEQAINYHLAKVQADAQQPFSRIIDKEKIQYVSMPTFIFITSNVTSELVETIKKRIIQHHHMMLFVVKGESLQLSIHEKKAIELLGTWNVFACVIRKKKFSDVFIGVDASGENF